MRTVEEIKEGIRKVRDARKKAVRKVERCNDRLAELEAELFEADLKKGGDNT